MVYEAAQKRNLGVTFEVVDEVGPSHKKIFTTSCVVGDLTVTGDGKSKKESKRVAAENILPQLMEIAEVSGKHSAELPRSKKSKKSKKNKVIKTTFDKIERMFDNAVDYGKGLVDTVTGNKKVCTFHFKGVCLNNAPIKFFWIPPANRRFKSP